MTTAVLAHALLCCVPRQNMPTAARRTVATGEVYSHGVHSHDRRQFVVGYIYAEPSA
jgi:hypothetical protein